MIKIKTIVPNTSEQVKYEAPDVVFVNEMIKQKNKIDNNVSRVVLAVEDNDIEMARDESRRAIFGCQKLEQHLRSFPKVFGLPGALNEIKNELVEDANVSFEVLDDGTLHVVLPELFSVRFRGGVMTEQYDNVRSRYVAAFDRYFTDSPFKRYKERVVVLYKSIYKSANDVLDYDNFDLKQITDFISTYCLIDDNPSRMLAISDYEIGEQEHSEVYVIPLSKFDSYSKDIFRQKD
ncbi:MAG: hypothetical protein J6I68_14785 [Butyrivibrio sp.]|uniref:DUF6100 family protein n=1 Tax=Butyrivibrio sp. TaxID=28121 RepID=UPI001B745324|nr:DUF6100 family protein [Butyrivibrio sp.]MBP3784509.1 hypothetical protein [Butyrivibrio sp.]